MSKRLTQKKLDQLFKVYCEKQSSQYVSKKCAISRTTVDKYKRLEDWDGRLAKVQQKAREKQDDNLADFLGERMKYANFFVGKILEMVQAGGQVSKNPAADLDKMIRLELLLRGEADSRQETKETGLKDVSTEELLKMRNKLIKETDI